MKGIAVSMQIECDCGELLNIEMPIEGQPPMLKEARFRCATCRTGYFLHIQEIKKDILPTIEQECITKSQAQGAEE